MNQELIELARIKCGIGYATCILSFLPLFWPWGKKRPIEPKRLILNRLRRQQSIREIPLSEFEELGNETQRIVPNILAFVFGQTISVGHLKKICVAELSRAGYEITHETFNRERTVFSCSIGRKKHRYYMTIMSGAFQKNCYAIWFDPKKAKPLRSN